jgi:hypothetical protein
MRYVLAASFAFGVGGWMLSRWIVRRRRHEVHTATVSRQWLSDDRYRRDGDARWQ